MTPLRPPVRMPEWVPSAQREAWLLAGRLYQRVPGGWTIVGGQMVQFHGWRAGTVPTRATTDLDAGIAARANPSAFPSISGAVQELGLRPVLHPSGVEHRWYKKLDGGGEVRVDLLLPAGLGARGQPSANGRPGVQSHGVQWATDLSRLWILAVVDQHFTVPVPSLLGAVVAKASALLNVSDRDPARHLSDIAFLAGIATAEDLSENLTSAQAARVIDAVARVTSPGVALLRLRMAMERVLRSERMKP